MCNSHEGKVTETQSIFLLLLLFSMAILVKPGKVWNVFVFEVSRKNHEVLKSLCFWFDLNEWWREHFGSMPSLNNSTIPHHSESYKLNQVHL